MGRYSCVLPANRPTVDQEGSLPSKGVGLSVAVSTKEQLGLVVPEPTEQERRKCALT